MRFFIAILLVGFFSNSGRANENEAVATVERVTRGGREPRGVGGSNTVIIVFPYHVSFEYDNKTICQGAMISYYHVLTVARCMRSNTKKIVVRAGSHSKGEGGSLHQVVEFKPHPDFLNHSINGNDIAIARVHKPFRNDNTQKPIPMFSEDRRLEPNTTAIVSSFGGGTTRLQQFYVNVEEIKRCGNVPSNTFCTLPSNEQQRICNEDAGAPVMISDQLAGIVSYCRDCSRADFPTVNTKISSFRKWISDEIHF